MTSSHSLRAALTVREAYLAMFGFLERYHRATGSEDVGALLGGMSLLPDGGTADPAVWGEWLEDVARAKGGSIDAALGLGGGVRQ